MAGKRFTRYYGDLDFRTAIDEQFALADAAAEPNVWITYAIHDPMRTDHISGRPEGLIVYVGQSKEFPKRIRKRMKQAGTAKTRPTDRIDGACYDMMSKGGVPKFSVLERAASAIDSLISETNWTKQLRTLGYPLLNQWTEQKSVGSEIDRYTVPHARLWPLTTADAIGSGIGVIVTDVSGCNEIKIDLAPFPANTRLREIKEHMKTAGRQARLHVL